MFLALSLVAVLVVVAGVVLAALGRPAALSLVPLGVVGWSGLVAAASMNPGWAWFGPVEQRGPATRPWVALTFDDGPDPASTDRLLEALARGGHRATFFLLADRVVAFPELARRIVAQRHELGLHGAAHHPWLTLRGEGPGAAELGRAVRVLEEVTGVRPTRFRPPFGAVSPRLFRSARAVGLGVCWCSVRTFDGGRASPEAVLSRARRASAGDIVLLHEGDRPTAALLPALLAELEGRGLRSVTVAELLEGR